MAYSLHALLAEPVGGSVFLSFPLVPKGGIVVIGAPSKTMKSFLAMNLIYDLAEGKPLFELQKKDGEYAWPVLRPLTVLYIEQEIGRARVKQRMERIHGARGGVIAPHNIYFECKDRTFRFDTSAGVERITAQIKELKADVIVFDPLRRFHLRKEDSSDEIESMLQPIYAMQEELGVAVILVHHTGKRSEWRDQTDPEALRGSSHLYAVGDTYMMITRPAANRKTLLEVSFHLRSHEDPPPLRLEFDKETYVFHVAGAGQ